MKGRRGLSPVIATVLLIALVLVLILIIFMWARGFVNENIQKNGKNVESVCAEVSFDYDFVVDGTSQTGTLTIVNRGNIPIRRVEIKSITGGDSTRNSFPIAVDVGGSSSGQINYGSADKVILYPVIAGTVQGKSLTKEYTCLENGQVLDI